MSQEVSKDCDHGSPIHRLVGQRDVDIFSDSRRASNLVVLLEAIQLSADDWRLHNALGEALLAAGRDEEAIGSFLRAVALMPQLASACGNIGRILLSRGLAEPAAVWLRRAVDLESEKSEYIPLLASAEVQLGHRAQARELLDHWVAADPENPVRRHMSLAILGESTPARSADHYISGFFDDYSQRFDESLIRLHYCGPQLILDAVSKGQLLGDVLDAGCGTGLVGELLRPLSQQLVGVDLSLNMLQVAAERNLYDELCHDEMTSFMRSRPCQFDIVVAADVLTYSGDLDEFCSATYHTLRPGGGLIVVLESLEGHPGSLGYRLNRSGRFSHHEAYVRKCMLRHELIVQDVCRTPMRYDLGRPIPTLLVAAEKRNVGESSTPSFRLPDSI